MKNSSPASPWAMRIAAAVMTTLMIMLAGCSFPGMKLLRLEVFQDGKLVLHNTFDAPDTTGPAGLWERTGQEPLSTDEKLAPLTPLGDDPLRARLAGTIKIQILHVKKVESSASLDGLELMRKAPDSLKWHLPEPEINRAKKAAGL